MKIFIDLDGVISDFVANAMSAAADVYPDIELPKNYQPKDWDFTDIFTKRDWDTIWTYIKELPDFWLRSKPIQENTVALRTWLKTTKHQVFYITSRMSTGDQSAYQQSAQWLIRHSLYPPTAQLIVTANPGQKKQIVEYHGIEMGIDDLPSTVGDLNLLSYHHCYLLNQEWNQNSNQARCRNLQEFLDLVDLAAESHQET